MSIEQSDEGRSGLFAILSQLPESELRDIARERGWRLREDGRAQLVLEIESRLGDPTEIARSVVTLPAPLRNALRAALVAEDGSGVTPSEMARAMSAMGVPSDPEVKPVEAAGFLADLSRRGLLLTWRDSFHRVSQYWLPWEIQRHIPPLPGWCPAHGNAPSPDQQLTTPGDALALVSTVWNFVSRSQPTLRPPRPSLSERKLAAALQGWPFDPVQLQQLRPDRGRRVDVAEQVLSAPPAPFLLSDSALRQWQSVGAGDSEQLDLTCHLLVELGLVKARGGRLVCCEDVWAQFQHKTADERARKLAHAYLSLTDWSELDVLLRHIPNLVLWHNGHFSFSYQQFRGRLVRLRHLLLRFLASAGETGWCHLESLELALRPLWPNVNSLLESSSGSWGLALRDSSGSFSWQQVLPWEEVQGRLLRVFLQGPLSWYGWVRLSLDDGCVDGLQACHLADWVWDRPFAADDGEPNVIVVDDHNDHLTLAVRVDAVMPEAHAFLGRIADLQEAEPGRFVYQLDVRKMVSEFERGLSPEDLLAEWTRCMPVEPPAPLIRLLDEWWLRYGQVRLYEGFAMLELKDDMLLQELEASTSLSQQIVARISPRLVLVAEDQVSGLVRELSERGYMPRELD